MSMATFLLAVMVGDTSMDFWVKSITERGLYQIRDDLIGLCKFSTINHKLALEAIKSATGLEVSQEELLAAVRKTYLRGLALERKQGYDDSDYTLPAQVFESPNPNVKTPHFVTPEFFAELKSRVWAVFDREIAAL
jgi:aldehyde:ferredoxin oxidoreductase